MRPEPWGRCLETLVPEPTPDDPGPRLIVFTPSGSAVRPGPRRRVAGEAHLILACGRYEGIDARVVPYARTRVRVDEVSLGDYVLNGGEAAALVVIEAVVRLLPA